MNPTMTLAILGQINGTDYRLGTIEVPSKVTRSEASVLVDIDQKEFKRRVEAFCAQALAPHTILGFP